MTVCSILDDASNCVKVEVVAQYGVHDSIGEKKFSTLKLECNWAA